MSGLDYSADGIRLAKENVADFDAKNDLKAVDGVEIGSIDWLVGDFFSDEWSQDNKFDLIFDYTVSEHADRCPIGSD